MADDCCKYGRRGAECVHVEGIHHAGQPERALQADATDQRVRHGTPPNGHVELSWQAQVVHEGAVAGEQPRVVVSSDAGAQQARAHGVQASSAVSSRARRSGSQKLAPMEVRATSRRTVESQL